MTTILYLIFFYTLHTHSYIAHILSVSVKGVKALFFWLDPKEPKGQDRIRSFLLKEKNQKFKAASAELLRHFVTLCAPQTRCAQTATLRPLHFVPSLNAHQNEANSIDN